MKEMDLTANAVSMNHVLRAYAVKGDTAGVEEAVTSYLEKGFVLTTQSINSILTLILNSPGKMDWDKFIEIYSSYFDSGNLPRNEETYRILFTAAMKSSNREQATLWYEKLLEDNRVAICPALRDAFHSAVGDEDFYKYNLKLTTVQRNKLSVLDNPPQRYRTAVVEKSLKMIKKKATKVISDSAVGKVVVPNSFSVASDLESASKKVWVPSSSSSKVTSDSAVVKVDVPSSSAGETLLSPSSIRNRLLKAAASRKNNFYNVVEQIKAAMKAANVEPTVDIMNAMILAPSRIGDVVATQRMIDEMKLAGLEPNPISISFLVSVYLRNSDKAGAERAWTEALTGGMKPGMTYLLL
jgi:hypothetical protein